MDDKDLLTNTVVVLKKLISAAGSVPYASIPSNSTMRELKDAMNAAMTLVKNLESASRKLPDPPIVTITTEPFDRSTSGRPAKKPPHGFTRTHDGLMWRGYKVEDVLYFLDPVGDHACEYRFNHPLMCFEARLREDVLAGVEHWYESSINRLGSDYDRALKNGLASPHCSKYISAPKAFVPNIYRG